MHKKMTKFNLEKFKIAKGVIQIFKVKCHKLNPETSYLSRYLHNMSKSVLLDKRCARESNHRFGYLGYGRTIVGTTEWSHAEQSLHNTEI